MNSVEAIIFDKDGTLFDFQKTWSVWAVNVIDALGQGQPDLKERIAEGLGFDLKAGSFLSDSPTVTNTIPEIVQSVFSAAPEVGGEIALLLNSAAEDTVQHLVGGAKSALEQLSQDYTLGVATNDAHASTLRHLRDHDLLEMFDFVAGSDSGFGAKPAPGQLLAFARQTGIPPTNCIMVGDSTHDLKAAKAANMRSAGVLTGTAVAPVLEPFADVVLPDITYLADWLSDR